ncbi:glycoprotein fp21 [Nannochloropsis gaditana]|uniref:Glycoprotein fp21 n=1 Tax=Nannochloropsis gaditana TaxID=72520 RepID=W7TVZ6_9STRA|nr:glycoprotein fp21 [Nannochloropsis gaditana]
MNVRIVLKNGQELDAPVEAALLLPSTLLAGMLEAEEDCGEDERTLELPSVEKTAFEYVMRFLRVHAATPLQDIPKPILENSLGEIVQKEYSEFIESLPYRDLVQVMELAHFLVLDPLLRLSLARVHFILKATPLEEFKRLFLFQNDLTQEEEKVRRETHSILSMGG